MIDLLIAAALIQTADPCNAAGRAEQPLANCPTWRFIAGNAQGRGFVDPASARRAGDRVEIMTRTVPTSPLGVVYSFNVRLELNCAERTTRTLEFIGFDANGVKNYERGGDPPRSPAPGSAFATMLAEFCPASRGSGGPS